MRGDVGVNPPQIAQSSEKGVSCLGLSLAAVAETLEMILGGLALQATDSGAGQPEIPLRLGANRLN
jgi:hypothetical protein